MADPITANHELLSKFCARVLERLGLSGDDAAIAADNMVTANLRGVDTHGVMRMSYYTAKLKAGSINTSANLKPIKESAATALIDGQNGLGQVVAYRAMEVAIKKARETGVAWVSVRNSNHFGTCAHYSMMALPNDMIGFSTTNASPKLAPTGGIDPLFGNNPWSFAVPAGEELPVVLDLANSVVAAGRIRMAQKEGRPIPEGWALTRDGEPTTDPTQALKGILLAIGGYKGYGITLMMDFLTGVLANSAYGPRVHGVDDAADVAGVGHSFMVLSVSSFDDVPAFKARVDSYIREIKGSRKAKGTDEIFLPGELEYRKMRQRMKDGIPLQPKIVEDLRGYGEEFGIPFEV